MPSQLSPIIIALMLAVLLAIGAAIYLFVVKTRFYVGPDLYLPRDEQRNFSMLMFFESRDQVASMTNVLREMPSQFEFKFEEGSTPNGKPSLSCTFSAMPNGIKLSRLQAKVRREAERIGGRFISLSVVFGPFEPGSV